MCIVEVVGFVASALVFATFYMTAMRPLRLVAIISNLAFIAYALLGGLTPILLLHLVLLPLNLLRLVQALRTPRTAACGSRPATGLSPRLIRTRKPPRRTAADRLRADARTVPSE